MQDKVVCKFYICKGECEKGKNAELNGTCKNCSKYQPRKGAKLIDKRKKEKYKYYE